MIDCSQVAGLAGCVAQDLNNRSWDLRGRDVLGTLCQSKHLIMERADEREGMAPS
jgi:hypothetical protein